MNKARRQVIRWQALTEAYEYLIRQAETYQDNATRYWKSFEEDKKRAQEDGDTEWNPENNYWYIEAVRCDTETEIYRAVAEEIIK